MNPAQLLAHFDCIGEAPDAVPRLRRFILDLAVRGKLVTQDSTETVRASIPKIRPQLEDCDTPENWRWTEFGEVAAISGGFAFKSGDYAPSGIFVLRVTNIEPSGVISKSDAVFLPKEKISPEIERFYLNAGDILLVMVGGSLGKIGVVLPDVLPALLNQNLWRITPANEEVDRHFLKLLIDFIVSFQRKITHSTHGHLSREDFRKKPISLPPLAEQHRIVAKVNELMELCDRLETAQTERESRRDRLVTSSLNRLNNGADPNAFQEHARFYFNHLPRLTTRRDHIKQLRQTILNLAVRGKLVPQDPTDEPATLLLAQLTDNAKAYALEQGIAPPNPDPIGKENNDFPAPHGWEWVRLASLFKVITDDDHQPPPKANDGIAFLTIGNITTGKLDFSNCRFVGEEYWKSLSPYRKPAFGDVLYTVVGATYGRPAYVETRRHFCVQRHIAILKPTDQMNVRFLCSLLASPLVYEQATRSTTGTAQPTIPLRPLRNFLVLLPPLAEQDRIVAKVDELMALCDQLEPQLTTTQSESQKLMEAILQQTLTRAS